MRKFLFIILSAICLTIPLQSVAQIAIVTVYQCAPCGCDSDHEHFDQPGKCPSCGMKLEAVTEPSKALRNLKEPMNVAILLYYHAQVLDYAGPYDVFTSAGENFNVYTVAETLEPVITMPNLTVIPQYEISNAPAPDIIIIPGGMWNTINEQTQYWIMQNSEPADHVFSVCTGAFILAEADMLNGLEATTHRAGLDLLQSKYPTINVQDKVRFVDNGKVITSAGVSAGIDASLHLISKILGVGWAEAVARNLEYNYVPASTN
ncbi:MAG: DJ-1/PfpI family protein [Cytophagales bacterium]|nr:DJ-1/PfpI family protein [Cytophagales bacterium]